MQRLVLPVLLLGFASAAFTGCSQSSPVGVYRLPVQVGPAEVELRTFLVAREAHALLLHESEEGRLFGRGLAKYGRELHPDAYSFDVPREHPLVLVFRDGLLEDVGERPYRRVPHAALEPDTDRVRRIVLSSAGVRRTFVSAGGHLFAESPEPQPQLDETPPLVTVLNSVSGAGLVLLPTGPTMEWRDAFTALLPPDLTTHAICFAPLISLYRLQQPDRVNVPAGDFLAHRITETVDACRQTPPAEVRVFRVSRWFAPGVGPVRVSMAMSDGRTREYRLLSHRVRGADGTAKWPLEEGAAWTFEVLGPDGTPVRDPEELRVESVREVVAR